MTGDTTTLTMRAVVADRFGAPDALTVRKVVVPEVGAGEVRVRIRSASLNPADWHGVVGRPYIARVGLGWFSPRRSIPGADVAGTVDAIGAGVTRFGPGDEVFGFTDGGGCAEYVVAHESDLAVKPAEVSFDAAAATGVAAFTALQAVRDVAEVRPGQHVLINGATGGVGHFALEIAASMGAEVTAVCSAPNVVAARALGADHVIDYTSDDFTTRSIRYDAILDNPGNQPLRACRHVLQPSGTYVLIGGSKAPVLGPIPRLIAAKFIGLVSSQRFALVMGRENAADLEVLRTMLEDGSIDPLVSRMFELDGAPAALAQLGSGHTLGKLVVQP